MKFFTKAGGQSPDLVCRGFQPAVVYLRIFYMNYSKTEVKLMEFMSGMDIIDCHEHLPPEKERTDSPQDVFTLFSHYVQWDLLRLSSARRAPCDAHSSP